jgi:hypothetical protein
MTTVAYDGKFLVSDSRITAGSTVSLSPFQKIYTPEPGDYWEVNGVKVLAFGVSGNATTAEYIKEKLREGINFKTKFEEKDMIFGSIIIDENGNAYKWAVTKIRKRDEDRWEFLPMLPPIAIGSGQAFAMGIFAIGKNAKVAVKTACRLDKYSGGDLQIFQFPGKPVVPSVRPNPPAVEQPQPEPEAQAKT